MLDSQCARSTRRQFVKGVVATGTGVAAAAYVKPSLRALGVPGALAQVSDDPAASTPVDSSTSVSTDPPSATTSYPELPSAGDGGALDAAAPSAVTEPTNESHVPELFALAVAGGLVARRASKVLSGRAASGAIEDSPHA